MARRWVSRHRFLLAMVTLLAVAVFVLPRALNPNRHLDWLGQQVGALLGGEVTLGEIQWGYRQGIWLELEQLTIEDAQLLPVDLTSSRIYLRAAIRPLLNARVHIDQLEIDNPQLRYRLHPPAPQTTQEEPAKTSASSSPIAVSLQALTLRNGSLDLEHLRPSSAAAQPGTPIDTNHTGRTLVQHFRNINLELSDIGTGQPLNFSLTGRQAIAAPRHSTTTSHLDVEQPTDQSGAGSGSISLSGVLTGLGEDYSLRQPWLEADINLAGIAVAPFKGYLNNPILEAQLGGVLSTSMHYAGNMADRGEAGARLDLSDFQYQDAHLWPEPIPGTPLVISADAKLAGDDLVVPRLQLVSNQLSLTARTTVAQWRDQAILTDSDITGHLPLASLAPLVPWNTLGDLTPLLRSLLQGDGVVDLHSIEFPDVALSQLNTLSQDKLFDQIRASIELSRLSLEPSTRLPAIEQLNGQLELEDGILTGLQFNSNIGPLSLPDTWFSVHQLLDSPRVDATIEGQINSTKLSMAERRQLLEKLGLSHLDLQGTIVARASYDHAHPDDWQLRGDLKLQELDVAKMAPASTLSARGRIRLKRKRSFDIAIESLDGRIDGAPFTLSGQLYSVGAPDLLANMRVKVDGLNLADLTPWTDALQPYQLNGRVHADLSIYYLHADPGKTRARGPFGFSHVNFYLPDSDTRVSRAHGELQLDSSRYRLDQLTLRVNDQHLLLNGELLNSSTPKLTLKLTSPHLDFDQLIPSPAPTDAPTAQTPANPELTTKSAPQLPELARRARLNFLADIHTGKMRGKQFDNLKLAIGYRQGQLQRAELDLRINSGHLEASATANLLNLGDIPFTLRHRVDGIDLSALTTLLSADGSSLASGPISSEGSLRGRTSDIAGSLRGTVSAQAGPGRIEESSPLARSLLSILSIINLKGIVSGDLGSGRALSGMPYDDIQLTAQFKPDGVHLEPLAMDTPAFSARALGDIGLGSTELDFTAAITVLGTFDTVLGFVPLIGRSAADLTRVYIKVSGTAEQPKVRLQPAEGLSTGVSSALTLPLGFDNFNTRRKSRRQ